MFPFDFLKTKMRSYGHRHRKKNSPTPIPLILFALFLIGAGYLVWGYFYTPDGVQDEIAVEISGDEIPKFRLAESETDFQSQSIEHLQEGESVKSEKNENIILYYKGTKIFLDKNTELKIQKVRTFDSENSYKVELFLQKGKAWLSVSRIANPESEFKIFNHNFYLTSRGGEISFDEKMAAVHSGSATVADLGDNTNISLETGQQIIFDTETLTAMDAGEEGPKETPFSESFRTSAWYKKKAGIEEVEKEEAEEAEEDAEEDIEEEYIIEITSPGKNEEEVTVSEDPVFIEGKVPKETKKVIVNDYALGKFEEGDTTFSYKASEAFDNLQKGKNKYEVTAILNNGDLKYTTSITIIYDPDVEEAEREEIESAEEQEEENITGKLKITSHKDGDVETEDLIRIKGTAPSNAAQIVVNKYPLSAFSTGDQTWEYRMKESFGNREAGEKEITVVAYDKNNKKIDTVSVMISIEALEEEENTNIESSRNTTTSPPTNISSEKETDDRTNWPDMRGDTLPPVESDDASEPTI